MAVEWLTWGHWTGFRGQGHVCYRAELPQPNLKKGGYLNKQKLLYNQAECSLYGDPPGSQIKFHFYCAYIIVII